MTNWDVGCRSRKDGPGGERGGGEKEEGKRQRNGDTLGLQDAQSLGPTGTCVRGGEAAGDSSSAEQEPTEGGASDR